MKLRLPDLSRREDFAGLDISDRYVAAARASVNKDGKAEVRNAGWIDLPEDATDRDRLDAVRTLWRVSDMPTYTVNCCMRSATLAMKPFRFRGMDRDEVAAAIRVEAEESLQTDAERFYVDWYLNGHEVHDDLDAGITQGMFVAARRDEVECQLDFIQKAGVYPTRLDTAPLAVANLYLRLNPKPEGTVGLVSMTDHWADVAIMGPGPFLYARSILSLTKPWSEDTTALMKNLAEVLEYYEGRLRRDPVERVQFTGYLPQWDELSAAELGVPVSRWNPMADTLLAGNAADADLSTEDEEGSVLAASLGLALGRQSNA